MTGTALGYSDQNSTEPDQRGARVASWVEDYMEATGVSASELSFRLRADKRDLQRLLSLRSCGSRLEDRLAAYFGWTFVEAVFAPVVPDEITLLEREVQRERAEMAAREARLDALRAAVARRAPSGGEAREGGPKAGAGRAR